MDKIREKLSLYQDIKYKRFMEKLIPNCDDIIGVRMPVLKKMAIQIVKDKPYNFIKQNTNSHEARILQALVIAKLVKNPTDFELIKHLYPISIIGLFVMLFAHI